METYRQKKEVFPVFERDMSHLSSMDWIAITALSAAMMVPFLVIMKNMADSLQIIAEKK